MPIFKRHERLFEVSWSFQYVSICWGLPVSTPWKNQWLYADLFHLNELRSRLFWSFPRGVAWRICRWPFEPGDSALQRYPGWLIFLRNKNCESCEPKRGSVIYFFFRRWKVDRRGFFFERNAEPFEEEGGFLRWHDRKWIWQRKILHFQHEVHLHKWGLISVATVVFSRNDNFEN